jgi:hypothetical protein
LIRKKLLPLHESTYYHPTAMRKPALAFLLLISAFAFAQEAAERPVDGPLASDEPAAGMESPSGRITFFSPSGGEISLEGPPGSFVLASGRALGCPAGEYLLRFRHHEYADYLRRIVIGAGTATLILPELERSGAYWSGQVSALEGRRAEAEKAGKAKRSYGWLGAALGAAAAGAVGGLEWLISTEKDELDATYAEYAAASADDAPALWARIGDQKAGIGRLRTYEWLALCGSGLFTGAGWVLASSAPGTADIDRQIAKLRGEAVK